MSEFTQKEREQAIRDVVMMECGDDYDYGQADFIAWDGDPESQSAIQLACERNRLRDALQKGLYLVSKESGWGTFPRMEGSQLYEEAYRFEQQARKALGETP